jgi:hypothetical protein
MRFESRKRNDQECFAAWDKKIENTPMSTLVTMTILVIIFISMNIFTIAVLAELNVFNLHF